MASEIVLVAALILVGIAIVFIVLTMYSRETERNLKSNVSDQITIYDDLIEQKQARLESVQSRVDTLEKRLKELEEAQELRTVPTGQMFFTRTTGYCSPDLKKDYRNMREHFSVDRKKVVSDFMLQYNVDSENERLYHVVCSLLETLSGNLCYRMLAFSSNEQLEILDSILEKDDKKLLDEYESYLGGEFDSTEKFIYWLDCKRAILDPTVLVKTAEESDDFSELSPYIKTEFDSGICEGLQIIAGRKLYDFAIHRNELG